MAGWWWWCWHRRRQRRRSASYKQHCRSNWARSSPSAHSHSTGRPKAEEAQNMIPLIVISLPPRILRKIWICCMIEQSVRKGSELITFIQIQIIITSIVAACVSRPSNARLNSDRAGDINSENQNGGYLEPIISKWLISKAPNWLYSSALQLHGCSGNGITLHTRTDQKD